jgi:hypothetical protein
VREDGGVRGPSILLAAAVALPLLAVAVLATAGRPGRGEEFQRLVKGLGLGAATDLSRCAAAFDPREAGVSCSLRHDPAPCGSLFCPSHAGGPD